MNIKISLLERLIELPTHDAQELRQIFDDLGLEVKGVTGEGSTLEFNIETLAHRGDHLSAIGMAREFSGRYLSAIKQPLVCQQLNDSKPSFLVKKLTDKCLRYALMEMHLPQNMKVRDDVARIMGERTDDRPAIVDLLNYIQLEIGQPMHAFDKDKIEGEVSVVLSDAPEEIEALDGKTYTVPAGSILIRDRKKTIAVAGVIGCANSMSSKSTTRVLIESATFDPVAVRMTARGMGLSTDASFLYERGADPETVLTALKRLVYLTSGTSANESAQTLGFNYIADKEKEPKKLKLKIADVRKAVNLPRLNAAEIVTRLKCLGYSVETISQDKEYTVTVPSWRRWNVAYESAVVEDFVRAYGLNRVKLDLPTATCDYVEKNVHDEFLSAIEPVLLGSGFNEVITKAYYSGDEAALIEAFDPKLAADHILLKNACDKAYSHLKVSNVINLANLLERNHRQGLSSCKVFEMGRVFNLEKNPKGASYEHERDVLSLAVSGRWFVRDWRKPETIQEMIKLFGGVIAEIAAALGGKFSVKECSNPLLHPGRRAALYMGRTMCGFYGAIHPDLLNKLGISRDMLYAEFDVDVLVRLMKQIEYKKPSDFPSIKKDLTVRVPRTMWAGKVVNLIQGMVVEDLNSLEIVDEFCKEGEDFRRVTFRMVFQSREKTLEHDVVDSSFNKVIAELKEKHNLALA
ncbi:MAG: phenylalanine--tRNA ligase subunit beta [Bdellovibrionota bacterium]|jgi:phenylalanyl-tRNA synthetase beta chain